MSWSRRRGSIAMFAGLVLAGLLAVGTASASAGGAADTRIVHGTPTTTAKFPWQAQLIIDNRYLCGGELISPMVVLTAAHCLVEARSPGSVQVTLGRDRTTRGGTTQTASAIVINPRFRRKRVTDDWAYAVLSSPAPPQFTPLQIAGPDETVLWRPGAVATVTGYGTTAEHGPLSHTLREVDIPVLADQVCRQGSSYGGLFDPGTMLCAGDPTAGKDSCQGDSGGPLTVPADDGTARLVGIVSFGKGCGEPDFPGVYTRIAEPGLSAELVQQLASQPVTSGYAYLGSGGACLTATHVSRQAARRLRHADRTETRAKRGLDAARARAEQARKRYRAHPTRLTKHRLEAALGAQQHSASELHTATARQHQARKDAGRAAADVTKACG